MKSIHLLSIVLIASVLGACSEKQVPQSALLRYDEQIDTIIEQLTLEEKVNMLHAKHMFVSAGVERLGIADMIYTDGPFGIREEMQPDGWMP
jgi:beta-glucosidase